MKYNNNNNVSAQSLDKQSSTSYWDAQSTAGRGKELEFKETKQWIIIIIIIIVHYMLAAFRLWHSLVQNLGVQPIFSFFSPQFRSIHYCKVLLCLLLFCPLSTGSMLYQF